MKVHITNKVLFTKWFRIDIQSAMRFTVKQITIYTGGAWDYTIDFPSLN